ncbi:MAG: hypothetical protein NW205_04635 [Hyphomicrobiaceae bacterium]|nr:hypothetical protein [Hyphomicrobiaceae bacterium]
MKTIGWICCAAAVMFGTTAFAFQEQKSGSAPATPSAAQGAAPVGAAPPAAPLAGDRAGEGTVVIIPGLGNLGVLPKMDFGLELLYGAAEDKGSAVERDEGLPVDDLTIRGTVKHRF